MSFELVQKAMMYSKGAHGAIGQKRKGTNLPYFVHCENVATIVSSYGGSSMMVAAAYLHDTVEDTMITIEMIKEEFGEDVANLVDEVTNKYDNVPAKNRTQRKEMEHQRISAISTEAKMIKMADIIDNLSTFEHLDESFQKVYGMELRNLVDILSDLTSPIWDYTDALLKQKGY